MNTLTTAIGRSIPRVDGGPKVTGAARFAGDIGARGLLHGRPVLALPAHALIERIDASAALAVPGVIAVLTAADLPIVTEGTDRLHEPLARREILWAGQPVALVIAETPEAAADAAALVMVETTPLEPILDLDRAIVPDAARARGERAIEEAGATGESQHAAVGGGAEEFTPDEAGLRQRRRAKRLPARRRGRGAGGQRCRGRGSFRDELGPPGLSRAPGRDGRARRGRGPPSHELDAGHVPHPLRAGQAVRPVDRLGPGDRCDAGRRASVASS